MNRNIPKICCKYVKMTVITKEPYTPRMVKLNYNFQDALILHFDSRQEMLRGLRSLSQNCYKCDKPIILTDFNEL